VLHNYVSWIKNKLNRQNIQNKLMIIRIIIFTTHKRAVENVVVSLF
jgi:hypothetical protein